MYKVHLWVKGIKADQIGQEIGLKRSLGTEIPRPGSQFVYPNHQLGFQQSLLCLADLPKELPANLLREGNAPGLR